MPQADSFRTVVDDKDLWILLGSTIRYSMERTSSMSTLASELVIKYRKALHKQQLKQIRDEVYQRVSYANTEEAPLGSKIDHEIWKRFINHLDLILARGNR